jgi:phospholipid/cholesterol/gamma-HCH transport system substrate-binding protein
MENKAHALAAGLFVVVVTAMLLALAAWLTRDTGVRDIYEISTRETVTGLQEQAPVRFRGVDVGKVSVVGFDQVVPGNVLIRLEVDRTAPITRETYAMLSFQGVTGLAFVQLADDGKTTVRLDTSPAKPARIPLKPGLLARLEARGEVILEQVEQVTQRVNSLLSDDNQKKFATALDSFGQAADSAGQLARRLDNTVVQKLDPALAETTVTLRGIQKNVDEVGKTAAEIGQTARRLNATDGPIDRLAEGTQALSHAADSFNNATLPRLNRTTEDTSRAVRALRRTVNNIDDNPQALIFGSGPIRPGPGEPGFEAPGGGR